MRQSKTFTGAAHPTRGQTTTETETIGYGFEVFEWKETKAGLWEYVSAYEGDSIVLTILAILKLKRSGCGCITAKFRFNS